MAKIQERNKEKIKLLQLKNEFYEKKIYTFPEAQILKYKPKGVEKKQWLKESSNLWNLRGKNYKPFIEILNHILKSYE